MPALPSYGLRTIISAGVVGLKVRSVYGLNVSSSPNSPRLLSPQRPQYGLRQARYTHPRLGKLLVYLLLAVKYPIASGAPHE